MKHSLPWLTGIWRYDLRVTALEFVDEPLVIQRFSQNSITNCSRKRVQSQEYIFQKNYETIKTIKGLVSHHCKIISGGYRKLKEFDKSKQIIKIAIRDDPKNFSNYIFLMKSFFKLK